MVSNDDDDVGSVITVNEPIAPEDIGTTITHEHLFIDVADAWYDPPNASVDRRLAESEISLEDLWYVRRHSLQHRENVRLNDLDEAIDEAARYYRQGGDTLVDVTPKNTGNDPERVRAVARATGLNVVHGTSYYTQPAHPESVAARSQNEIEEEFVDDIRNGFDETGIRAGLVGEIGISAGILDQEEKVLRAGARAARRTGTALSVHPPLMEGERPPSEWAHDILDIVEEEGLRPERVVMGHQDMVDELDHPDVDRQLELARRGAFVEFDLWGWEAYVTSQSHAAPSDNWRARATMQIIDESLESQLLFSQDVNHKWQRTKYGGFGYAHILRDIVPLFRDHGVANETLDTILVDNPRRMLTVEDPEP